VASSLLLALTLVFSGCVQPPSETEAIEIGRPAPVFKLPDLNGREVSLDQFRGKIVMLDFWATWCNPCRMTMPLVEKLQKEYPNNMVLLAINLQETKDVVREYMRQQNLGSQVLLDEEGSVGKTYGTEAIPMQVLIDKTGIVRDIKTGFDPRMLPQLRAEIERLR
jgi:thiol-disulfide isomerase/thioredoxin